MTVPDPGAPDPVPGDPVPAARALADRLLRPAAEQVDLDGVRAGSLQALADAGLYGLAAPVEVGGGGVAPPVAREVAETLAGACGATWFVWTQHAMPLGTLLAGGNIALQERHLRALATGATRSGVAFAHLRRPGPPAVRATRTDGGWRVSGTVDWVTGWGLLDVFLLAARTPDDRLMMALLPTREVPGLVASPAQRLAVMQGTQTVGLVLDDLRVDDADVAQVTAAGPWLEADRLRTANAGPHTFGLLREVVDRLAATAERRGDATAAALAARGGEEAARLRTEAYRLLDHVPAERRLDERLAVRAAALELVVRVATALVTATGGMAMSSAAPAQRLAREALFHLVQAQTRPVREATLTALTAPRPLTGLRRG